MLLALAFAAVTGLAVGSFLNVVVHRLPRGGTLNHPGSHCPSCGHPVRKRDNVPVVSWLLLRGRCRDCAHPISPRYPVLELVTAVLWVAVVAAKWDDPAAIALGIVLVTLMVAVVPIDLEHRLILNKLTYPAAILALVIGIALDPGGVPEQLIAAFAAGGFFLLAALAYPAGMGLGDVKLAFVMGLYLGRAVAPAVFVALIVGVLAGVVVMARLGRERGRRTQVPFGPFLALGSVLALFTGDELVDAYLQTF
ncbi:MAG: Leader peptidase (Prepilin peptidase) / N-methyltransferase [uncultured Solirubrobacteraceae bacterium]|uniref:Leader peptidase (Prepilin peptidase) / N-methyltransferase n=1 Tax=uncultured Solirubrobacteraceae bacterium TaxID=1162706 RepID=A0A6J4RMW1_9ACTN|nr:MAG: Leader peptidase (Prepilin peptidase) / N-methyltransferase [uncultured Solirubrobacteraceae bacterium]